MIFSPPELTALAAKRGVAYLFKPAAQPDTATVRLRGLSADARSRVTFEDGTQPAVERRGDVLMAGLDVALSGEQASELMFFEEVR